MSFRIVTIPMPLAFFADGHILPVADDAPEHERFAHRLASTAARRFGADKAPAILEPLRPFDDKTVEELALYVQEHARKSPFPGTGIARDTTPPHLRGVEPIDRCELMEAWIFIHPMDPVIENELEVQAAKLRLAQVEAKQRGREILPYI